MDDETESMAEGGNVTSRPSGDDVWVVDDEPVVVVEWFGASTYAKQDQSDGWFASVRRRGGVVRPAECAKNLPYVRAGTRPTPVAPSRRQI